MDTIPALIVIHSVALFIYLCTALTAVPMEDTALANSFAVASRFSLIVVDWFHLTLLKM